MLDPELIPTPLVRSGEKPRVGNRRRLRSSRLRTVFVSEHLLLLAFQLSWLKLTRRLSPQKLGNALSTFLLRMGGLWIKVGQLLSMRADLLPAEVCYGLARLQDFNEGFAFEQVRRVVEEDLGHPLEQFFSEFEQSPFAAASIAQVHRARLKNDGDWTAVKVQMPDAETNFQSDLAVVRVMVWLLTRLGINSHVRWSEMLWEVESAIREELDFRYEATNMRRMRKSLLKHGIYVPRVFTAYSTKRVLVMEYLDGVLMSDYIKVLRASPERVRVWQETNNVCPHKVAKKLLLSFLRQSIEENLFHGDLHPGNVVMLRHSRIALLDFGSVGFTERDLLRKYGLYMQAMIRGQYMKMADIYLLCADRLPPRSLAEAKELFCRRMQLWEQSTSIKDLPYALKSASAANDELIRLMGRFGVSPVWGFLRQTRALYALDLCFRELSPESNIFKIMRQFFRIQERRLQKKKARSPELGSATLRFFLDAPIIADETVLFRETVIRRSARVLEGTSSRIAGFIAGIFNVGRLLVAAIAAWLLLVWGYQHFARPPLESGRLSLLGLMPHLDNQVWILLALLLIYLYRTLARLKGEITRENLWESAG